MTYNVLQVSDETIQSKDAVRNLSCLFDCELKMRSHVQHILKIGFKQLRKLNAVRQCLTFDCVKTLVV